MKIDSYRVLLVDDRAQLQGRARALFTTGVLAPVGEGSTPERMLETVLERRPHVILLDVSSDRAFTAIEDVMAQRPTPILVLHHGPKAGTDPFKALALGALDMAELPLQPTDAFWQAIARRIALLAQVRVVQHVRGKRKHRVRLPTPPPGAEPPFPVVAIAASLGGPKALSHLLSMIPRELGAPICICQHISDGFTWGLANWLASESGKHVVEARQDEPIEPGTIYVAPSRAHLRIEPPGRVALDTGGPIQGFRPSCDVLLESVAQSFGRRTIGVILTGMGRDGAMGLRAIRDRGGRTIAQDESSCVVFGMPREAILLGAAQEVLPLEQIPAVLVRWVAEC
jgi:two-component system, chemotaxis family, protein-glutamate methylesterase/glutaminase